MKAPKKPVSESNPDMLEICRIAPQIPDQMSCPQGVGDVAGILPGKTLCFARHTVSKLLGIPNLRQTPASSVRTDHHHRCVLLVAVRGSGQICLDADTFDIHEGQAQFICPFQFHSYTGIREGICWIFITFEILSLEEIEPLRSCPSLPIGPTEWVLLRELIHCWLREDRRSLLSHHLGLLLRRFCACVSPVPGVVRPNSEALGAVPTVGVAYMNAWEWARLGASAARLTVAGGMRPGQSENIVAELPGQDPDAEILFIGAHHDTQADSVGADDNGSGVVGLLALARVLAPQPRRRTIRLISFGAEEQLSVGSSAYVRTHREELRARGRLMFNLDSFGSLMGWTEIISNGPPELVGLVRGAFARHGLPVRMLDGMVPYADHFPFVAAEVPGLWMWRPNCPSGRFFHHRPDDDLSRLSFPLMSRLLTALAEFEGEMANVPELPFGRTIPANQADSVKQYWDDLFGGWK